MQERPTFFVSGDPDNLSEGAPVQPQAQEEPSGLASAVTAGTGTDNDHAKAGAAEWAVHQHHPERTIADAATGFWNNDIAFVGAVDGHDPAIGIKGWVVERMNPDDLVRVEAIFDAQPIGSVLAAAQRPDISAELGRELSCGFLFRWEDFDAEAILRFSEMGDGPIHFLVGNRRYRLVYVHREITLSDIVGAIRRTSEALPRDVVAAIDASDLFDDSYYRQMANIGGDRLAAIRHYIAYGEKQDIRPCPGFDVAFYRQVYGSVAKEILLLYDFIKHGYSVRRYTSRDLLAVHAKIVLDSGLFDHDYYLEQVGSNCESVLNSIEHYLCCGWSCGMRANRDFDDEFYFSFHEDVRDSGLVPFIHYIKHGRKEWRLTNKHTFKHIYDTISPVFDRKYYRRTCPSLPSDADPVEHYLSVGIRRGLQPTMDFSPEYYWRRYPDIRSIEPFSHYLRFGQKEGRLPRPHFASLVRPGQRAHNWSRETLLLVSHDGSRTGAPLVSYALGEAFTSGPNIIHMVLRDGPLVESFRSASTCVIVGSPDPTDCFELLNHLRQRWNIKAAILSSVETLGVAEAAQQCGIPTVALIHEFPQYSLPPGKVARMVAAADFVVVPARLLEEAAQREVNLLFGTRARNIKVRHQGYLHRLPLAETLRSLDESEVYQLVGATDRTKPRIILGAGYVQIRKGVDIFVQTAAFVRDRHDEDVRFIWVGSGYRPEADIAYSVWVRETVMRLNLAHTVCFLPEQSDLEPLFRVCDVFFLSSRLDPFPNVVIDAAVHGKPVVCFENATGVCEAIEGGDIDGKVVRYGDAGAAADAIIEMLSAPRRVASKVGAVAERFDFRSYASYIDELVETAVSTKRKSLAAKRDLVAVADRIEASGLFDAEFHEGRPVDRIEARQALLGYVSRAMKGLCRYNPRPGFHDGLYRGGEARDGAVPLDDALEKQSATTPPTTHKIVILKPDYRTSATGMRIAVHLHLHYADLAFEFSQRISALERNFDLFITTTSINGELSVRYAFARYRSGKVEVSVVPNRGRDIGALATGLKDSILTGNYDLIGHLHGKKSVANGGNEGERWRKYLLDNLCGDRATLDQIIDLFQANQKVGLVFAEDRHVVGWSDNLSIAEDLANRMVPCPKLPPIPCFPVGTMFWARPAALKPIWDLELDWSDYPVEPVPYDGTILHALERMLPSVCEAAGFEWMTVYREGTSW